MDCGNIRLAFTHHEERNDTKDNHRETYRRHTIISLTESLAYCAVVRTSLTEIESESGGETLGLLWCRRMSHCIVRVNIA